MLAKRRFLTVLGVFLIAGVLVTSAYAVSDYVYSTGSPLPPNQTFNDFTLNYRNYNDSCSNDGVASTKSIYGLSDGSWVATIQTTNACGSSKAHLGPSTNYGYTYVQSKCQNKSAVNLRMICNTTRP